MFSSMYRYKITRIGVKLRPRRHAHTPRSQRSWYSYETCLPEVLQCFTRNTQVKFEVSKRRRSSCRQKFHQGPWRGDRNVTEFGLFSKPINCESMTQVVIDSVSSLQSRGRTFLHFDDQQPTNNLQYAQYLQQAKTLTEYI